MRHDVGVLRAVLIVVIVVVAAVLLTQGHPLTSIQRGARGETWLGRAIVAVFQAVPPLRRTLREPWRSGSRGRPGPE
jgi:hypothetical protein